MSSSSQTQESLPQNLQLDVINESSKQLESLEEITKKSDNEIAKMKELIDEIDRKNPKEMAKLKQLIGSSGAVVTSDQKVAILKEIQQVNFQLADQTLTVGDQASAELAVHQMIKLTQAWDEIKVSYNIEKESSDKIKKIDSKIDEMQKLGKDIEVHIEAHSGPKHADSPDKKKAILNRIRVLYTSLRTKYIDTRKEIGTLKIRIGNQIVNLKFVDTQQNIALVQNVILGVVSLGKAFKGNSTSTMACLAMADSGGHFTRAALNVQTKLEISKAKKSLEALLTQIDQMEIRLAEIQQVKRMAKEFLMQNGFERLQLKE